jgi:hypothetical protein
MTKKNFDLKVEFTNNDTLNIQQGNNLVLTTLCIFNKNKIILENNYIEFTEFTRQRNGTLISNEKDRAEKIINDIVFMDAAYDLNQLPDLSTGIRL